MCLTKSQVEAVHAALTEIIDGWNDAAADDDRGRSNDFLCLTVADDGSGMLGRRVWEWTHKIGESALGVEDWFDFKNLDELMALFRDQGIDVEEP